MGILDSQGFLDYVERCVKSEENSHNLLDKLQDATGRGQSPFTIFPPSEEPEIITITEPDTGLAGFFSCFYTPNSVLSYSVNFQRFFQTRNFIL